MSTGRLLRTAAALKLALLRGGLRPGPGSTGRRVGLAISALGGAVLALVGLLGLTASRGGGDLPGDLAVVLFSGLVLGWVVLPVLTFSSDDLLDPTRLALLPLTGRQRVTVMGVGALVGVPAVATTVAALGLVPATASGPLSAVVALVATVLLVALCVSASRAVASVLAGVLRSRRGRDVGVALTAVVALGFQLLNPLVQVVARRGGASGSSLHALADLLRWSPAGWLAAAPGRAPLEAVLSLVGGAAAVVVLLAVWDLGVRRSLRGEGGSGARRRRPTTLAPRLIPLPRGRTGAVAAKDLRYLVREPRRLVAVLTTSLVPVLVVVGPALGSSDGPGRAVVFTVCGVGLLAGAGASNRFGVDGSSTWLLLSSAGDERDARRDLAGGDLAVGLVVAPVIVLIGIGLAALVDGWADLPAAVGLALALLAVQVAVSGVLSVRAPIAVAQRAGGLGGSSGGQGCAVGLLTVGGLLAGAAACVPLLALLLPALLSGSPAWGPVLLVVGPAYGLVVGAVIRRRAARQWAQRAPEVLQVVSAAV